MMTFQRNCTRSRPERGSEWLASPLALILLITPKDRTLFLFSWKLRRKRARAGCQNLLETRLEADTTGNTPLLG